MRGSPRQHRVRPAPHGPRLAGKGGKEGLPAAPGAAPRPAAAGGPRAAAGGEEGGGPRESLFRADKGGLRPSIHFALKLCHGKRARAGCRAGDNGRAGALELTLCETELRERLGLLVFLVLFWFWVFCFFVFFFPSSSARDGEVG